MGAASFFPVGRHSMGRETWLWSGNSWKMLATANAPPERTFATMAFDGSNRTIVLFGGVGQVALPGPTRGS